MNERVPYGKIMMRRMGKVCGHGNWLYNNFIQKMEEQIKTPYNRNLYETNLLVCNSLY